MALEDLPEEYQGDIDPILDEHFRLYLAKAKLDPDPRASHAWITNVTSLYDIIKARQGQGGDVGEVGALAEAMLVPDDPDAQVGAMVERYGREEVLRVIGEDVNREAAGDGEGV